MRRFLRRRWPALGGRSGSFRPDQSASSRALCSTACAWRVRALSSVGLQVYALWDRLCYARNFTALFGDASSEWQHRQMLRMGMRVQFLAEHSHKFAVVGDMGNDVLPRMRGMQYGRTLRYAHAMLSVKPLLAHKDQIEISPAASGALFNMGQYAYSWQHFVLAEAITRHADQLLPRHTNNRTNAKGKAQRRARALRARSCRLGARRPGL